MKNGESVCNQKNLRNLNYPQQKLTLELCFFFLIIQSTWHSGTYHELINNRFQMNVKTGQEELLGFLCLHLLGNTTGNFSENLFGAHLPDYARYYCMFFLWFCSVAYIQWKTVSDFFTDIPQITPRFSFRIS